ncbi:DUF397 domain-containing protein [Streptomyces sp. ACA25]|uniref:DUF397 domain-containing protein n=1 Tax=Streptomyces sp. ACA25 TaxID=3022596 RepID=UPI002307B5B4|nr:DUF397 domain-containing protein [Streptomyces sp. ACA25]MDB1088726.1 DUF397 domain-containing protein [Streptomyces sp. ACA25]
MRIIDVSVATWRKSSYSNSDGGACIEVSDDFLAVVPVRDSKIADCSVLVFPAGKWSSFVEGLKAGDLSA